MNSKKIFQVPLKYLLIAVSAILALAIVIACVFGFNTSVEFGGGSQIKVQISADAKPADVRNETLSVLKKNHINVESSFVEDYEANSYLVVRTTCKDVKKADEIRAQIAEKVGVDVSSVSDFEKINSSLTVKYLLLFGGAVLVSLAVVFIAGTIRYKLMGGLTLSLVMLGNFLLYFAILALTRIWLSSASLVALIVSTVISLVLTVSILENVISIHGTKQFENASEKEIVTTSTIKTLMPTYFVCGIVALFSVIILFVPNSFVQIFALSALVGVITSVFMSLFVGTGLYTYLFEINTLKQKQRVSKNPEILNKTK